MSEGSSAGIIGRTLRLMLALLLGWLAYTAMRFQNADSNLRVLIIVAALAALYTVSHFCITKRGWGAYPWLGSLLALTPLLVVFSIGGSIGRLGVAAFLGVSLLLQTTRAERTSEVMAIATMLLRKPTHLMGILFAPIDLIEQHLTGPGGLPG